MSITPFHAKYFAYELTRRYAALKYCNYATEYTIEFGGKPWKYALIPHDQVNKTNSFKGVVSNNIYK